MELVIAWLRDAGAQTIAGNSLDSDLEPDGREIALHFPAIGPLELWPSDIRLDEYAGGIQRWKRAVLAKIDQEKEHRPQIDADRSAVAGLKLPEIRDGRYWIAGEVWFPTSRLRVTFPELNRICQRFERFLRKHPTVFDNTKGPDGCGFGYQLCMSGVIHRVVALPEAFALLKKGAFMVDHLVSPKQYAEFRRRLQLSGYEV